MSTHAATAEATSQRSSLLRSRLGSFLALFPLSVWVVNHLWDNLAAFQGAEAWERSVTHHPHPFASLFTWVIVFLPLVIHTVWGIARLTFFKPNVGAYPYFGNVKYLVQRISAVGALLFILAHVWLAFLQPRLVEGHAEPFVAIAREMHFHAPTLIVYLLGTLGVCYHLANGLQGFFMGWGVLTTERSMRRFEPWAIAIFVVLLAMSWGAIFALYQAGGVLGPPAPPHGA